MDLEMDYVDELGRRGAGGLLRYSGPLAVAFAQSADWAGSDAGEALSAARRQLTAAQSDLDAHAGEGRRKFQSLAEDEFLQAAALCLRAALRLDGQAESELELVGLWPALARAAEAAAGLEPAAARQQADDALAGLEDERSGRALGLGIESDQGARAVDAAGRALAAALDLRAGWAATG